MNERHEFLFGLAIPREGVSLRQVDKLIEIGCAYPHQVLAALDEVRRLEEAPTERIERAA